MIFLIGMPGAGKTYWGEKLEFAHNWRFTDLDNYIEDQEKMTIAALFEQYGEDEFRKTEHRCLARVIDSSPVQTVIACGGGTPCFHRNMGMMKQAGQVVYLQADVAFLMGNLQHEMQHRPLLDKQPDAEAFLAKMLEERRPVYEQAHYILQTKDLVLSTFDPIIKHYV